MPVWLDAVPEKAARIKRPNTRRWLIFWFITQLTGALLTLWRWEDSRSGFVFWFTAIGLPFCIAGLCFSLRRVGYKLRQVAAQSWDWERERIIEAEIRRGQRHARILSCSVQMKAGKEVGRILEAIAAASPLAEPVQPREGASPVSYAALTEYHPWSESTLALVIAKITARLQEILLPLPPEITYWLMIECNSEYSESIRTKLTQQLTEQTQRRYRQVAASGLAALDAWLDQGWETPSVFIAVILSLPASPQEGDADAIAALVLANRKVNRFPDATLLCRPERGGPASLSKTLSRALLWAETKPEAVSAAWITGPELTQGTLWHNACKENNIAFSMTEAIYAPDAVIGYAGCASSWLAVALAQASPDKNEQLIACQPSSEQDELWVMVVKKDREQEGLTGNV